MKDRMYCRTCKRLFPDMMETRKAQKVITVGQFLYNQQRVMWDEPVKFTGNKRVFIINCPYCNSMHNVNATEIMEQRTHGGDRRSQSVKLYKRVKEAFEKEGLNTMSNIVRYGDRK